jgi:ribosomal-protein-alanine N-acetyltransferase
MNEAAEIFLRPGVSSDLSQVEEIEHHSFSDPWPRSALLTELQTDRLRWPLVAEMNGRVVGYLMAWRIRDQLHVMNLAIRREMRRQGTGTMLLQSALNLARQENMREVTLEVRESNRAACRFYGKHGFVPVGRRCAYYRDTLEDAIIMTWSNPDIAGLE